MFNTSLTILLALACTGCSLAVPSHRDYRDSFETSSGARVSARLVDQTDLSIYVDGQQVLDEHLSLPNGEGRFRGQFNGQPVTASCSTAPALSRAGTSCSIAVGRDSQTLRFF